MLIFWCFDHFVQFLELSFKSSTRSRFFSYFTKLCLFITLTQCNNLSYFYINLEKNLTFLGFRNKQKAESQTHWLHLVDDWGITVWKNYKVKHVLLYYLNQHLDKKYKVEKKGSVNDTFIDLNTSYIMITTVADYKWKQLRTREELIHLFTYKYNE